MNKTIGNELINLINQCLYLACRFKVRNQIKQELLLPLRVRHNSRTPPKHNPETTRCTQTVSCAVFLQTSVKITRRIDTNENVTQDK